MLGRCTCGQAAHTIYLLHFYQRRVDASVMYDVHLLHHTHAPHVCQAVQGEQGQSGRSLFSLGPSGGGNDQPDASLLRGSGVHPTGSVQDTNGGL